MAKKTVVKVGFIEKLLAKFGFFRKKARKPRTKRAPENPKS